jgi:hypothetical protein
MQRVAIARKGKSRGERGTLIGVRLQPKALAILDAWAAAQFDSPTRPEAIRRLLAQALGQKGSK